MVASFNEVHNGCCCEMQFSAAELEQQCSLVLQNMQSRHPADLSWRQRLDPAAAAATDARTAVSDWYWERGYSHKQLSTYVENIYIDLSKKIGGKE